MGDYVESLRLQMYQQFDTIEHALETDPNFIENDAHYRTRIKLLKKMLSFEIPYDIAIVMASAASIDVVINNEADQQLVDRAIEINCKVTRQIYIQLVKDLGGDGAINFCTHMNTNPLSIKWSY